MSRTGVVLLGLVVAGCGDRMPTEPSVALEAGPPLASSSHAGQPFAYSSIQVPDARGTVAFGINARGDVVGSYVDADRVTRGFLLRDGAFTTIEYPRAAATDARGIGPDGTIVGTYRIPGEPGRNFHGYRLSPDGEFSQVDFPGHTSTMPQRILPDGTILGCRHDGDFMETMRGVVIGRSGATEIDAFASMNNGATPDLRRITGLWRNRMTGRTEAYVITDDEFESFVVPDDGGPTVATAAWDMNAAGDIVGNYGTRVSPTSVVFHGFLRSGDTYLSIDFPEAAHTRAFGINARGNVVGSYVQGGITRGFLARREG